MKSFTKMHALVILATAFGVFAAASPTEPQSAPDWQIAAGGKMAFDVASVKQNKSGDPEYSNFALGPGNAYAPNGGLLIATIYPLFTYITFAYKVEGNQWLSLQSRLPKWVLSDRFDIQARAQGNPTKDQMRLMMQSLLADRFKLVARYETRQVPVFGLVLAEPGKTGPQLRPHSEDPPCPARPTPGSAPSPPPGTITGGFPDACGGLVGSVSPNFPGRLRWGGRKVTIGQIVGQSTGAITGVDRLVLDQTGLSGDFDFVLEFAPAVSANANFQPDESGPTFIEALKDQLGLKLDSHTGTAEIFVVDHIEEPTAN